MKDKNIEECVVDAAAEVKDKFFHYEQHSKGGRCDPVQQGEQSTAVPPIVSTLLDDIMVWTGRLSGWFHFLHHTSNTRHTLVGLRWFVFQSDHSRGSEEAKITSMNRSHNSPIKGREPSK